MNGELVSFCLISYNQKDFFKEALKGAFAQTYNPLEIIVVDNGSTDGSHEMIIAMIDDYRRNGGKHQVSYIRIEKNIGPTKGMEKGFFAAHGCLVFEADGDDVSYPTRVERVYEAWVSDGRKAGLVYVGGDVVDNNMKVIGSLVEHTGYHPLGAAVAYSRRVFDQYEPIPISLNAYQDLIWGVRCLTLGNGLFVPEKLIAYRLGGVGSNPRNLRDCIDKSYNGAAYVLDELKSNLSMEKSQKDALIRQIENDQNWRINYRKKLFGSLQERMTRNFGVGIKATVSAIKGHPHACIEALQSFLLCLPYNIGQSMYFKMEQYKQHHGCSI